MSDLHEIDPFRHLISRRIFLSVTESISFHFDPSDIYQAFIYVSISDPYREVKKF